MKITVGSGKGGTGKTTISVSFASALSRKLGGAEDTYLLDCDVEEPNSHLFLDLPEKDSEDVFVNVPEIHESKCDHCGMCSKFCKYNVLAVFPGKAMVFQEMCHQCGGCYIVCPNNAISERQSKIGVIESGFSDGIKFVHGILNIGEARSVPLINKVKEKVFFKEGVAIVDAPPGTACSFVETVTDSDFCILVAEPTPFGFHDFKLALKTVEKIAIPFGVIINKDSRDYKDLENYCHENEIEVFLKVPNDLKIAEAYSVGKKLIDYDSKYVDVFYDIYKKIEKMI